MKEDFVSFDLAKKLKEKGFDEECLAYYTSEYTLYLNKVVLCDDKYLEVAEIDYEECLRSYNTQKDRLLKTIMDAPTISQVLKWLREDKDVDLVIYPIFIYNAEGRAKEYHCKIYAPQLNKPIPTEEYRNCHELAVLDGIEYVLDNLI